LSLAGREAEWLIGLFADIDPAMKTPVPILVDNAGVVSLVFNPVDHQANKHIKVSCHYARELTESKRIIPKKIASESNLADLFTKPLPVPAFRKLASQIVQPPTSSSILLMHAHSNEEPAEQPETKALDAYYNKPMPTEEEELKQMKVEDQRLIASKLLSCLPRMEIGASIVVTHSKPLLMCGRCGIQNSTQYSQLRCGVCAGQKFFWSCACSGRPARKRANGFRSHITRARFR
jgi:hypothetical protein